MASRAVALGIGVGGALVDVSQYIKGPEGVTYSWGRQSEFRDPSPGTFTFVLDNYDGRFTPGNTSTPLATPLTEGTAACWQHDTRLVAGTVASIGFAGSEDQWGRITITVGDVFYPSNRNTITDLAAAIGSADAFLYWRLNEPATSAAALESSGSNGPALVPDAQFPAGFAFGATATAPTPDTQLTLTAGTQIGYFGTAGGASFPAIAYPTGSGGSWGMWVTPQTPTYFLELDAFHVSAGTVSLVAFAQPGGASGVQALMGGGPAVSVGTAWEVGTAHYVECDLTYVGTTATMTLYIDGTLAASSSATVSLSSAALQLSSVRLAIGDGTNPGSASVAHLAHAPSHIAEELAGVTTTGGRLNGLVSTIAGATLGALDANLSTAAIDRAGTGSTCWSMLCDLLRTEQGHVYAVTTGSLLNPSTQIYMRARTRPATPVLTLDAAADVSDVPQFDRDITNLVASITASGPTNSVTVTDPAAVARVGNANTSETVNLLNTTDLLGWAQDRLIRGENVALKVTKVVVDTVTSDVTSAQILGLVPGDRIRISNLPSGPLGFTSWDGWFLGADEVHNYEADTFTLYLAPVLPATGVFDADRFSAGGDLSLSAAITSSATTMVVHTQNPTLTFLETVQVPYNLQIDQEQVTVTACTALVGSTQTATVTRGANGTTPAAHAAGALVDLGDETVPFSVNWYPNPINQNPVGGLSGGCTAYATGGASGSYSQSAGWQIVSANALPANSRFGYDYVNIPVGPIPVGTSFPVSLDWSNFSGPGVVRFYVDAKNAAGAIVGHFDKTGTGGNGTLAGSVTGTDVIAFLSIYAWIENTTGSAFGSASTAWFAHTSLGASTFFYGGSPGAHWTGAPNNSPSAMGGALNEPPIFAF